MFRRRTPQVQTPLTNLFKAFSINIPIWPGTRVAAR